MQTEWNRYLAGISTYKEQQGMLLVFCICVLLVLWHEKDCQKKILLSFITGIGIFVLFPLSAVILLKGYTPFYDWMDLFLLFPIVLILAWGSTWLIEKLPNIQWNGLQCSKMAKTIVGTVSVVLLLFVGTTFHCFDQEPKADKNGVPKETADMLDRLWEEVGETPITIAANSDIMIYIRMYEEQWVPLYGKDLWDAKAASYINSGYEIEYEYFELLEKEQLSEQEYSTLIKLVETGPADCVIVPTWWVLEEHNLKDCIKITLTEAYTAILKKD